MDLKTILKTIDLTGFYLVVYIENDEDPLWTGSCNEVPWWVAEHKLVPSKWGDEAISYRCSLGKEYNNKPGFIIILQDTEDD